MACNKVQGMRGEERYLLRMLYAMDKASSFEPACEL